MALNNSEMTQRGPMPKMSIQDSILNQIKRNGYVTIRKYSDGRGARVWNVANRLREEGRVRFRGVRTPVNADFQARAVSLA